MTIKTVAFKFLLITAASAFSRPATPSPFLLSPQMDGDSLNSAIEILQTNSTPASILEVIALDSASKFQPLLVTNQGIKDARASLWFKLTLHNPHSMPISWYLELQNPAIGYADIYIPPLSPTQPLYTAGSGMFTPPQERHLYQRKTSFSITTQPESTQVIYLNLRRFEFHNFAMKAWSYRNIIENIASDQTFFGFFYGIAFIMIIFNLGAWLFSRQKIYIIYTMYLLFMVFIQISYNGQYVYPIWPNTLWVNGSTSIGFFTYWSIFAFMNAFLSVQKNYPKIYFLIKINMTFCLIISLLSLFIQSSIFIKLSILVLAFASCCYVPVIILQARQGFFPAYYLLIGTLSISSGLTIYLFAYYGWIPSTKFTENSFFVGSMLDLIAFSLGLIHRFIRYQTQNYNLQYKNYRNRAFPHFLFNSLSALDGVINERSYDKAKNLTYRLTEIYHFITYKGLNQTTLLGEEIDFCKQYINIMNIRYERMINLKISIPPDLNHLQIPPFLLQSFLENAIKHGLSEKQPLNIEVSIHSQDNLMILSIENNGRPIEKEIKKTETLNNMIMLMEYLYEKVTLGFENTPRGTVLARLTFSVKRRNNFIITDRNNLRRYTSP